LELQEGDSGSKHAPGPVSNINPGSEFALAAAHG
jgi:hypothetical protein